MVHMIKNFKEKVANLSELVMFKHSIFSFPFIFIAMVVASNGWFGFKLLFLGALSAIGARNFAMGVNRYLDRDIDILNNRTKTRPSVDGRVSQKVMIIFIALNALLFILVAYFINDLAFMLSFPILVILASYTIFKRFSSLAHIILGISLGLAPIAGDVAVSGEIHLWAIFLAVGVTFWVAGFDLLYSLQDIDFDILHKLHSIPSKFGAERTLLLAKIFHIITIIFWLLFVIEAKLEFFAVFAVVLSAFLLGYEHYLIHKDFNKIDKAFFTVNGYLGIIFFVLVVIDVAF